MKNGIDFFGRKGTMFFCAIACVIALAVVGLAGCDDGSGDGGGGWTQGGDLTNTTWKYDKYVITCGNGTLEEYLLTMALASHKSPTEIIGELVREKVAAAEA
ncbi:MAG: hypothetical protein LBD20_01165 [Spirochaetaceae bacterium]|jgi:hypothetical protein|nr:hypothetical protein [Spirochaetaceae bacterium]